jgi:creatinine amidohydrolase
MDQRPYILAETTWETVRDTNYDVAVLPWGSTEAHNYHLPYATDTIQCDYIAAESARRAWESGTRSLVLPTVPFGVNTGHLDLTGTINMHASTQAAVLHDVVSSLRRQGFRKLVVLNGHGGNDFTPLIREVQNDLDDVFVCAARWFEIGDQSTYFAEPGDHAGEMETSVMLHVVPELVRPLSEAGEGRARTFRIEALRENWAWAEREWPRVTDDTGVGNPAKANREKGKAYLDRVTDAIADLLRDLDAADLDDLYREPDA